MKHKTLYICDRCGKDNLEEVWEIRLERGWLKTDLCGECCSLYKKWVKGK